MELAEQIGILGPCSFEDCEEFADYRCEWSNQWRLTNGGCQELYCVKHGFVAEDGKEPVCCQDCDKAFNNDKWRIKAVLGLGISILVLTVIVVILFFTVIAKDDSSGEVYVPDSESTLSPKDTISDTVTEENAAPFFDDTATTDIRVFSESMGFEIA